MDQAAFDPLRFLAATNLSSDSGDLPLLAGHLPHNAGWGRAAVQGCVVVWPDLMPRTLIDADLVRLVRDIRTGASNVPSPGSTTNIVMRYRSWADEAIRQLRHRFSESAVDVVVRTSAYWATIQMPAGDQTTYSLVMTELTHAGSRLQKLETDLAAFLGWWDDAARIVVLDTSAVMSFGPQVGAMDWFAVLDKRPDRILRLVLPLIVIDELDNLKDRGNNTSQRQARASLKALEPMLQVGRRTHLPEVKHDGLGTATVEVLADPPAHQRLPSADDEIVQQAAMLKATTGLPSIVATRDTGMLIRAQLAQLEACRVEAL